MASGANEWLWVDRDNDGKMYICDDRLRSLGPAVMPYRVTIAEWRRFTGTNPDGSAYGRESNEKALPQPDAEGR